jgi:hypothetical protein
VLIQYVPHAYGWKAMNLPFVAWLLTQRRRPLWIMFHEVAYPIEPGQPCSHRLLALVTRAMVRVLLRAASRVFVSIPAWEPVLRQLGLRGRAPVWLPIPSNLPLHPAPEAVGRVRAERQNRGPLRHVWRFDPAPA